MSDNQILYLLLILIYLLECFHWVDKRAVIFSSPWCGNWKGTAAGKLFGNPYGSLIFLNPLPPLGKVFLGHVSPISISPDGITKLNFESISVDSVGSANDRIISFEEIADVLADGKYILINGARFAKCSSSNGAVLLAGHITDLSGRARAERDKLIREHALKSFSIEEASGEIAQSGAYSSGLRWTGSFFFIFLFIAVPVLAIRYDLPFIILPVALTIVAYTLIISLWFYFVHKRIYPLSGGERLAGLILLILCPLAAIRAADRITLRATADYHPVLLGSLLLGKNSREFTASFMRELKFPLRNDLVDPGAYGIAGWHARLMYDICAQFISRHTNMHIDEITSAPIPEKGSAAYCPRCHCQFESAIPECPDCPGVEPVPFANISMTGVK